MTKRSKQMYRETCQNNFSYTIDSQENKRTMAVCQLPSNRCRSALDELAKEEGFNEYELSVTSGLSLGENFLGEVFKVIIDESKDDDESKSLHLIVKVSLKIPVLREDGFIQGVYEREAYVYKTMLPILDDVQKDLPDDERFEYAKFYGAILEEDEEIIMMEDLCKRGYRMLDRMNSFNYEQLVVAIKTLARFHATSFVLKTKMPEVYEEIYARTNNLHKMKDAFGKYVVSCKPTVKLLIENEPYEDAIERFTDHMLEYFSCLFDDDITNEYSVLIHGDSWNNNFLFKDKDEKADKMILVDWQLLRNASPVIDISYVLMLSIDSEMRCKHYNEMLDLYYETLSSNVAKMGVDMTKCYPSSVYREQVRKYMKFGLLAAIAILPVTLSNKEEAMERSDVFEHFGVENAPIKFPHTKASQKRLKELFKDCVEISIT